MVAVGRIPPGEVVSTADQRVILQDVTWAQFEAMVAYRGDRPVPRYAYSNGTLEIMNPSRDHERIKSHAGAVLEAYLVDADVDFRAVGSWLLKSASKARGLEPDECYIFGPDDKDRPDLAVEVIWTSGGIDKLEIYAGLGIPEVWLIRDGRAEVYALRDGGYAELERSGLLPDFDLALMVELLDEPTTSGAIRKMRASLGG